MKLPGKRVLMAAFAAVAVAVSTVACATTPVGTVQTNNPEIKYEKLFDVNGCEVGRFHDYGRSVHIVTCPNGTASASDSVSSGKTIQEVVTVTGIPATTATPSAPAATPAP